jgi:hypothetical protein
LKATLKVGSVGGVLQYIPGTQKYVKLEKFVVAATHNAVQIPRVGVESNWRRNG